MAVHNLGYRGWAGELAPAWSRFVVITVNGVRRAWTSKWLRRMMYWAWGPTLIFAAFVFIVEQVLTQIPETDGKVAVEQQAALQMRLRNPPFAFLGNDVDLSSHESIRHTAWGKLLQVLFRYPQGFLMVMLLGIIAPPLISQDVRSRAFLLYFSRPINRWEYLLGKAITIWVFLTAISVVPAFCLYILGVLLSPSAGVVLATWDLPFDILLASGFLMVPTSSLALCLSSMTQESRVAAFAWFAIWILGFIAVVFITAPEQAEEMRRQMEMSRQMQEMQSYQNDGSQPPQMNPDGTFTPPQLNPDGTITPLQPPPVIEELPPIPISKWTYLSLYHTLGIAQAWAFGFETFERAKIAIIVLAGITLLSTAVLYRKVSAPMRA